MIREVEPPKLGTKISSSNSLPAIAAVRRTEPRKLAQIVRGELDWITMKALEKDRDLRYQSAADMRAVFDALGVRVRDLPITRDSLIAAMELTS